LKTPNK